MPIPFTLSPEKSHASCWRNSLMSVHGERPLSTLTGYEG